MSDNSTDIGPIRPFDAYGDDYDYATASKFKMRPDNTGHWSSRAPNGQILKGALHPTFYKTIIGEHEAGYTIYPDKDGKLYSHKLDGTD